MKKVTIVAVKMKGREFVIAHGSGPNLDLAVMSAAVSGIGRDKAAGWRLLAVLPGHLKQRAVLNHLNTLLLMLAPRPKRRAHGRD